MVSIRRIGYLLLGWAVSVALSLLLFRFLAWVGGMPIETDLVVDAKANSFGFIVAAFIYWAISLLRSQKEEATPCN